MKIFITNTIQNLQFNGALSLMKVHSRDVALDLYNCPLSGYELIPAIENLEIAERATEVIIIKLFLLKISIGKKSLPEDTSYFILKNPTPNISK